MLKELFNLVSDNGSDENQNSGYNNGDDERQASYIRKHFDVEVFASSCSGNSRSVLACLQNIMAKAMDEHNKFPKYIIYVVEDDLLRCINFDQGEIAAIFQSILNWLTEEVHWLIQTRKNALPTRAKKYLYPQVFWAALPLHLALNNRIRQNFNSGLESSSASHNEMKVLKIKRIWSFDNANLVSGNTISGDGKVAYWKGINEAIKFWENGKKKPYNHVGSGQEFVKKMRLDFDRQTQGSSGGNWNRKSRNKQVRLPRV